MPTLCWIAPEIPHAMQSRRDRLAGLADLRGVRVPAGVDDCPRGAATAPPMRQRSSTSLKPGGRARGPRRRSRRHPRSTALALGVRALDHGRRRRKALERDVDLLDLRGSAGAGLLRIEGAGHGSAQGGSGASRRRHDRVAERRALPDQVPVLLDEVGEIPVQARLEPGREPGSDVGREDGGREEHGVEAAVLDDRREASTRGCGSGASELRLVDDQHLGGAELPAPEAMSLTPDSSTTPVTSSPSVAALERTRATASAARCRGAPGRRGSALR